MLATTRDSGPCNVTLGPSAATKASAWSGGGCGGGSRRPYPTAAIVNDTPPSSKSPNPYKRRGLLPRRSPPPLQQKFDVDDCSSSKGTTGGLRPAPPTSPPGIYFDGSTGTDVKNAPTTGGGGNTYSATPAGGPPTLAGGSPILLDSSCRDSRASSGSASPHIRLWYPADPRPSSGGNGEVNDGGGDESAYVVHPTFRRMFDDRVGGIGGGGSQRASSRRPTHGAVGLSRSQPAETAAVSKPSERGRKTGPATRGGGREGTNAYFSVEQTDTSGKQRRSAPTTGPHRVVDGRRSLSTQDGGAPSPPTKSTARVGPNLKAFPGACSNNLNTRPQRAHAGRGEVERQKPSREPSAETAATVRGRVRDLQISPGRPRRRESPGRLSTRDNCTAGGDQRFKASAVFLGHTEQVLALARHKDILFSAAVDGTAKAWDTYSQHCLATYEGHRKAVWGMQVSNRTLITGSADCTVRFWDIETAQSLHVVDLRSSVRDVVIVGDFLAVATSNPGVEVIDLHHMKRRGRLEGHLLAVSAVAAIEGEGLLVTGSHDTFLRVWDPFSGNCEAVLGGHGGTVGALCTMSRPPPVQANRKTLMNEGALIVSGSGDSTVRVWGRAGVVGELREWACRAVLEGHRHGVWAVHGSSTSGVFATGGGDATVKIWAPRAVTGNVSGDNVMLGGGQIVSEEHDQRQHHRWECVGGVRGAAGAVGAVLVNEEALVFGTSEALIARFPLKSCMPTR